MNIESKVTKQRREDRKREKREAKALRKKLRRGKVILTNAPN